MNRESGILFHISSLPNSYGCGSFGKEARMFVDFLKEAGFTQIQVYGDRKLADPEPGEQRIYIKARKGKIK